MGHRAGTFLLAVAVAVFAPSAAAQEQYASERPAAEAATDTLILRDGGLVRGRIAEIVPGDHVTLTVEGGEAREVPWSEVERVIAAGSPSQPALVIPANPSAPAATAPAAPPTAVVAPPAPVVPEAPPNEPVPRPVWRHNRPLVYTGALVFAAGYAPVAAAAVPSTAGLAGRVALIFLTLGLVCLGGGSSYVCTGEHGAMQLLIPVVGPILFAADHPRDHFINERGGELSGMTKGLLYASAGVQAAGLITLVSGIVFGRYERAGERPATAASAAVRPPEPTLFVRPLAAPGALGLSVGAYRW